MGEVGVQDLAAWLLAQVQADEQKAVLAGGKTWQVDHSGDPCEHDCWCCRVEGEDITIYDEGGHGPEQAQHIADWDPARVLVECDTKRRIIELHARPHECIAVDSRGGSESWWIFPEHGDTCLTLRLLALPYADRDGYREEWRP